MANKPLKSIKYPGLTDTYTFVQIGTEAGQAADAKLTNDEIEGVTQQLIDTEEYENLTSNFVTGAYIATNKSFGQTIDLTPAENANYKYGIFDCKYGDKFIVGGRGGGTPRFWTFVDIQNKVIEVADNGASSKGLVLDVPIMAVKLIVNDNNQSYAKCLIRRGTKKLSNIDFEKVTYCSYVQTFGDTVPHSYDTAGNLIFEQNYWFNHVSVIIPVKQGQEITLTGGGGGSARLWAFVDARANVINGAELNEIATGKTLVVPENAVWCIINLYLEYEFEISLNERIYANAQNAIGNVEFVSGYILTPSAPARIDLTPTASDEFVCAVLECVKGETIKFTATSTGSSGRAVYSFVDFNKYIRVRYLEESSKHDFEITAPFNGYFVVNCLKNTPHYIEHKYNYALNAPLSSLPPCFIGSMAYKPLHDLSQGYICLMSDDGRSGLVSDTIPLAISKNVPFTFAIMKDSEVCQDQNMLEAVIDAIENHGCSVAQHSGEDWSKRGEDWLNNFFDAEKEFFDSVGISLHGAVIPGAWTTELIKAVCGGRFGVVRSGYAGKDIDTGEDTHTVDNFYSYYTSGGGSNIYCLSAYNNATAESSYNMSAVDYAYANHKVLICYFHENSMDAERWQKVSDMIDYAKQKGLTFVTLGDIPHLK